MHCTNRPTHPSPEWPLRLTVGRKKPFPLGLSFLSTSRGHPVSFSSFFLSLLDLLLGFSSPIQRHLFPVKGTGWGIRLRKSESNAYKTLLFPSTLLGISPECNYATNLSLPPPQSVATAASLPLP